jgi:PKD repeat protein
MIEPENSTPQNESENDAEDQQSQQDIHSDGIEGTDEVVGETEPDVDGLQAAEKASEAAFTLNVDKGIAPKKE